MQLNFNILDYYGFLSFSPIIQDQEYLYISKFLNSPVLFETTKLDCMFTFIFVSNKWLKKNNTVIEHMIQYVVSV